MIKYMMEIDTFEQLEDLCWSGGLTNLKKVKEKGLEDALMELLLLVSEGEPFKSDTEINDFIWFDLETFEGFEDLWE